jgi:hypothetical protein
VFLYLFYFLFCYFLLACCTKAPDVNGSPALSPVLPLLLPPPAEQARAMPEGLFTAARQFWAVVMEWRGADTRPAEQRPASSLEGAG